MPAKLLRQVNCDEGKPSCKQCTRTGRSCDGYGQIIRSHTQPRQLLPTKQNPDEARALYFFRSKVVSSLSGPYSNNFWSGLVLQLSESEPIVRHSLVAISSLYHDVCTKGLDRDQLRHNQLALLHYNLAIQKLKEVQHEPIILLGCLLFICIEILQDNRDQAITHCRHGLAILRSVENTALWTREHLHPILKRLSILQLFFGANKPAEDPQPLGPIPINFFSFEDANNFIEDFIIQAVKLMFRGDAHRYGSMQGQPIPPTLFKVQAELLEAIRQAKSALQRFEKRYLRPDCQDYEERQIAILCLEFRAHLGLIMIPTALEPDEMAYDQHTARFRHILRIIQRLHHAMAKRSSASTPWVRFEPTYLVMIHPVVLRCRHLVVRLEALKLLKTYDAAKESFWERDKMYQLSKRTIEIEHDITLDEDDRPIGKHRDLKLPPDHRRVRNTIFDPETELEANVAGTPTNGTPVGFIMRDALGNHYARYEFLMLKAVSRLLQSPEIGENGQHDTRDIFANIKGSNCQMSFSLNNEVAKCKYRKAFNGLQY
ncbi:Aspercryptin biosynthesis cluster-specific transcription regulator atnN [Paramyrothecium foliicola]|nr:Aspercryptin biosynthesis cluster-specific transcription regulator atnN [Paramyrothecium foliicola]